MARKSTGKIRKQNKRKRSGLIRFVFYMFEDKMKKMKNCYLQLLI